MSALQGLIFAAVAAVFVSAPAVAAERVGRLAAEPRVSAQDACRDDAACGPAAVAEFCIAEGTCAMALPAASLIRYDALMDAAAAD